MQSLWPCKILRFMVYMSLGSALLPNQMISEEYFKYYYWLGEETWHLTQVKKQLLWLDMSKQKWQSWIMWYCCVTDGGTLYTIKELIRYTKKESDTQQKDYDFCCWIDSKQDIGFKICTLSTSIYIYIYIVLVLLYIDLNLPWVYMCSPSWTPLPSPSPSHPSGSSQCSSPEHPVSCIKPGLVIHFTYGVLHVSMPFSHIILPSPSPTESRRLFNTVFCCVSFAVSHIGSSFPSSYILYICVSVLYWCFSFWLTSLCIIGSSFIHLIRTDSNVFLMAE